MYPNSVNIKKILGENVKKYRKSLGYTQMKLAEILEVDQKHISFIESGNTFPSANLIAKIAQHFNISPKELFDYEEKLDIEQLKSNIIEMINNMQYEDINKIHNYASFLSKNKIR